MMIMGSSVFAQQKTKNLVIVTLDGYWWKELFAGADEELINTKAFIAQKDVKQKSWIATPQEKREVFNVCCMEFNHKTETTSNLIGK